jgi:hypothetical protein
MRRATILLLLALPGGLLVACGSTTQAAHPTPAHASATGATGASASRSPSRAEASAFARAVNLTAADVPGFTASPAQAGNAAHERQLERTMLRCAGASGSGKADNAVAEAGSKSFALKRGVVNLTVSSEVSVEPSQGLAAGELGAIRSARVRGCFTRYLNQAIRSQKIPGATIGKVSIQSGNPPAPGTSGGFGWRITVPLTVRQISVAYYLDILGFVYGPTVVTLVSTGLLQPFPAAAQQHLFSLLLGRAKEGTP